MSGPRQSCHPADISPMISLADALRQSLWARSLTPEQLRRVETTTIERRIGAGQYVCRKGERVEHWIGIVEGLVKMANLSASG